MYKVNDVVVHENGGVYRIVSIGKPDFVKGQEEYYTMKSVWDDSSMIYVKINNDKVYMRPVISKAEARSYLEKLSGIDAEYDTNNKEREKKNRQILKSCEVSQYLELMKAILLEQEKKKQGGKKLNCSDEKDLQRAEKMLISELAVVSMSRWKAPGSRWLRQYLHRIKKADSQMKDRQMVPGLAGRSGCTCGRNGNLSDGIFFCKIK